MSKIMIIRYVVNGREDRINMRTRAYKELGRRFISRNGPYIGGHLAFYFKLNFKQVYNVL